jgi:hypothetical protein
VNVSKCQLEVYTSKAPGWYPAPLILRETQFVDPVIAGKTVARIPVADLLYRKLIRGQ